MRLLFIICLFFVVQDITGQNAALGNSYYNSGEYEKAARIYKSLYDKSPGNDYYFGRYIESLLAYEAFDEAEDVLKKALKKRTDDMELHVYYGNLYEKKGEPEKANKQYQQAIKNIPKNTAVIGKLANSFSRLAKYELAIDVYKKGNELIGQDIFSYNIATLYNRLGNKENMIDYYIKSISRFSKNLNTLINAMQRNLAEEEDIKLLQQKLYEEINKPDAEPAVYEVLEWTFIHNKEYYKAFRQARSIDRKENGTGEGVLKIADIAYHDGDYNTAIEAYDYVAEKGALSPLYLAGKRGTLNSRKNEILSAKKVDSTQLSLLETEYRSFIEDFGANRETAGLLIEFANYEALFMDKIDTSIIILKEVIELGDIDKYTRAKAKIDLADYLLIQGERWESTLLYSQVDKDLKEAELGERARFKNAMLSYYSGDFEWAQEQFDILKRATSRLISNDAIDMSVFIIDNLGLDTTDVPLKMFSQSDLLIFQNKYEEAFKKLNEIENLYPEHGLTDDILYRKAGMNADLGNYDLAIEQYERIIETYPEEIRADNAIYNLAEIYENVLEDNERAMELYQKLFLDYSNSTFAVEARKRFRVLRGDNI